MTDYLYVDTPFSPVTKFLPLYTMPHLRYLVFWGGRGAAKSWSVAEWLTICAYSQYEKILCTREYQTSIKDSVHALLKGTIERLGLSRHFRVTERSIVCPATRSEFIFDGLHANADQIKSKEGITKCWVEEAHRTTAESWKYLVPTIRVDGSQIIVTYNQHDDTDPIHEAFVTGEKGPPPNSIVVPVTWQDNPHFSKVLDDERRYMMSNDPEAYEWVWGLATRSIGSSIIFKGKCLIHTFDPPERVQFRYGGDFGFAADPSVLLRTFITKERDGDHLWIDQEAYGHAVELDDMPEFYDRVPGAREWPIKADGARPETISYLARKGFNITAAEKWPGSVEDGIAHLKRFRVIHIHERCPRTAQESRLYAYRTDKLTGDVLPVIVDKNNHCWDSARYSLDGEIQHAGGLGVWAKLAGPAPRAA